MRVILLFEEDPECVNEFNDHRELRTHYNEVPRNADCLVVWQTYHGDPDGDGHQAWEVIGTGRFEEVTPKQIRKAVKAMLRG